MSTHDPDPRGTSPDPTEVALVLATRVAAWTAIVAMGGAAKVLAAAEERRPNTELGRSVASDVAGAVVTVVVEAERGAADTISVAVERVRPLAGVFDALRGPVERFLDAPRSAAEKSAGRLAQAWDTAISLAIGEVLRHVDLDEVAGSLDVDAVVEKVDIDKVIGRLDLDGIVDRVNVDPIVDRVDVERLVRRIDLNAITRQVLDDLEIAALLRESTGSLGVETVDALRERGVDADQRFARFVDALLRRREERQTSLTLADAEDGSRR